MMESLSIKENEVRATIPHELYMAIVKVQARDSLRWNDACLRAAELLDCGSFEKAVKLAAQRIHMRRFMTELNKARESIKKDAWDEGAKFIRRNEDNFRVPCRKCGSPMRFSSRDEDWSKEQEILNKAFSDWNHVKCPT